MKATPIDLRIRGFGPAGAGAGSAQRFALDPPYQGHERVRVIGVTDPGDEGSYTYLASDDDDRVELPGSRIERHDIEGCLVAAGYEVEQLDMVEILRRMRQADPGTGRP